MIFAESRLLLTTRIGYWLLPPGSFVSMWHVTEFSHLSRIWTREPFMRGPQMTFDITWQVHMIYVLNLLYDQIGKQM